MRILIITVCYALVTQLYLSLFQHPHSTVTLVISIQTNLVTYVKQLVSCKWLSHNHKAPTACQYCSFEWSKFSSPCFVSIYISISILFQLEHPLAIYSFLSSREITQYPSLIFIVRTHFFFCCSYPFFLFLFW